MSRCCCGLVFAGLVLPLGFGPPAAGQDRASKGEKAEPAPKVARQVYVVRAGSAKELANALSVFFRSEPAFQVVPDAGGTALLLSGPPAVLEEVATILRQIDRADRTVLVEVFFLDVAAPADNRKGDEAALVDRAALSGPVREVTAKVRDYQRRGVIVGDRRVVLTALEGRQTLARSTESKPFVTGVNAVARGGPAARNMTYRDVGMIVQVKPEFGADGLVTLELQVEDSRMRSPENGVPLGADEKGAPISATEIVNVNLQTRLRVQPGHPVLAQGATSNTKGGESQFLIVVAVTGEAVPSGSSK